jgi:hypothetical protein
MTMILTKNSAQLRKLRAEDKRCKKNDKMITHCLFLHSIIITLLLVFSMVMEMNNAPAYLFNLELAVITSADIPPLVLCTTGEDVIKPFACAASSATQPYWSLSSIRVSTQWL